MAFRALYVAVFFVFLTLIVVIISFSTPSWLVADGKNPHQNFHKIGLWEICYNREYDDYNDYQYHRRYRHDYGPYSCKWIFDEEYYFFRDFILQPFFVAVQVFFTLGLIALLVAGLLTIILLVCMRSGKQGMVIGIGIITLFAAICCTLAVIIFGALGDGRDWMPYPDHNYLSWSFGLGVLGAILAFITAILFFADALLVKHKQKHSTQRQSYRMEQTEVKNVNL
ncbi:uncharacterized protein [Centruroides vittatus]|uniref:uncharacterized protein LOC111626811 n=1 Tax=Centruroides sculpturatus TaxID=218467 RepID=UPI000C6DC91F|nr:uncharacterized protein LOC111626811 [Centruroides sculpturatus]